MGAIAYTYLNGFYQLSLKNRDGWMRTFRHRMYIMVRAAGQAPSMHVPISG